MAVPPPPYSPEMLNPASRTNTTSTQSITSPASTLTGLGTPSSAATTISPDGPAGGRSSRSRPVSMIQPSDFNNPYRQPGYFPLPPPPKDNRPSRLTSQNVLDEPRANSQFPTTTTQNRHLAEPGVPPSTVTASEDITAPAL